MKSEWENKMKFAQTIRQVTIVAIFAILLPAALAAQSIVTGGITGTVTDASGAVVVGATATLTNVATGESQTVTSNGSGIINFALLKPGAYTLTVSQNGFKSNTQPVDVVLGQVATVSEKLEVGSGATTVEVTSQGQLLQTENANISSSFDTREIENIPNPGNDLSYVAQTAPGVSMNTTGLGQGNFSAFGLPGTANLFTVNGNDYNDPFINVNNSGASNLTLGTNEIQEVAVVSNGYTGQYGRQAGAQIDYTTKSGGNAFHGDAVYYWNGSALNARDFFHNDPKAFENNNQWAASLGGPIKKDKSFFFVNTEGLRYTLATSSAVFIPDPAFQQFVLSQIPATATPFYNQVFNLYNGAAGINNAVAQPNSCGDLMAGPGGTAGFVPIGGGAATTNCLDSFNNAVGNQNEEWLISGRVDYSFNDSNKIFGRFRTDHGTQPTVTDPFTPLFNISSIQPQYEGQLNYTHVFSPTVVNNFIFSYLWYSAVFQSPDINAALNALPVDLQVTDSALSPLGTGSGNGNLAPGFFVNFPQGRDVQQWQIVDDLAITRGNHAFKMGVNFRRDNVNDFQAMIGTSPAVNFTTTGFVHDTANLVLQNFTTSGAQPLSFYTLGLYFQDEYRVSPKLKLTLALRADRNSGGKCQSNCASVSIDPFNQLPHDPTVPYNQMVTGSGGPILRSVEQVVIAPRFGLAWTPVGQNTVIRAGVGLFTDAYPGGLADKFTTNFPQVTSFSLATSGAIDPSEAGSAVSLVAQCSSAFQTNFAAGGNVGQFLSLAPAGCAPPNLNDVISKTLNPKYVEWNAEIQRTFGARTVVSINYVGNRGYDLLIWNPYLNAFNPTVGAVPFPNGFGGLPPSPADTRVGGVIQLTNNAVSNYNGVTASIQQNLWHGFSGRLSYTYSHSLDDASNGGIQPYSVFTSIDTQINPFNLRSLNYGHSDYDLPNNLTASYVWALPFKSESKLVNAAIGGWTVSGTFFVHSGFPFSVVDGFSGANLSQFNAAGGPQVTGATVLAQPIQAVSTNCTSSSVTTPCFTTAQFAVPGSTTSFGTIARNSFRGPAYFNTDISLRKDFRLTERFVFQVGANAFNILNHPNFASPLGNLAFGSALGQIVSTVSPPTTPYGGFAGANADARIVQVIGKLTF
jgi:hypothetical protein